MISRTVHEGYLDDADLADVVRAAFTERGAAGKKVLCVIPDSTRSMPMPAMFRALHETLSGVAAQFDILIALGTHQPMPDEAINKLLGVTAGERAGQFANVGVYNHAWKDPNALRTIGTIDAARVSGISGGLMEQPVDVTVNKMVFDYDLICIVGPVFPHEVAGFSGGNKYFFPGIAGQEIIDLFHWLGALITNPMINGTKYTPVREVIDTCASFIDVEKMCLALVVADKKAKAIFAGTPEQAWSSAADVSSDHHIVYKDRPYDSVLAVAPGMYDDLWVAGKCMYKLEPVVADGGELIIYAPHVTEISYTHGEIIRRIGYHTRDYFLAQMDKFADVPGGVLAHSTHVRGIGRYEDGVEKPRVQVTLATGIPEEQCRAINLGYRDPASINPEDWANREDEGRLLVRNAGEILYRLRQGNPVPTDAASVIG